MKNSTLINGLVSIGIPTYNRPESLERALRVATSQTYRNLEIIVSDNASPGTEVKRVVEEFMAVDPRIKFYRQATNTGLLANTFFVLRHSAGEYFTWLSDDDWRSPEFVEILVAELDANKNSNLAFCDYHEVLANGDRAPGYPSSHVDVFKPFTSPHRLIRLLSYYLQDGVRGKCNLFYSLFRKSALDTLDFASISSNYSRLNTDSLVVFSMLCNGPVRICQEAMCALTCGNTKYYDSESLRPGGEVPVAGKLARFFSEHNADRVLFTENTNSLLEKVFINTLFLPKFLTLLILASLRKVSNIHFSSSVSAIKTSVSGSASKLSLPRVTLVAMATRNVEATLQALQYSCRDIDFGSVKLLSHYSPHGLESAPGIKFFRIEKIASIDDWSRKIIYDLPGFIDTDFALLVHADGFVVNPSSWRDEFLNYDYTGAPWPLPTDAFSYRDTSGNVVRVGNSVSLRSKRLLDLPITLKMPWEPYKGFYNEDGFVCVKNKHIYEENGMRFAPLEVAKYFSHESMLPETQGIKPFAFHKWAGTNSVYPRFS